MPRPLDQAQRETLADANLIQQAQQAALGTGAEQAYSKSLISPEEIQRLREEALQNIRRAENAYATPGTDAGLNAAQWGSIQGVLPKFSTDFGGLIKSPTSVFDLTPEMVAAERRGEYNKQYGTAENEALKGLANIRQNAEAAYSAPVMLQTQPNAMLAPSYAQAKANIANLNAATAGSEQGLQQSANQPKNVEVEGGFGNRSKYIQDVNDPSQFSLPPSATPDQKKIRQETQTAWHDVGANDFERNRNLNTELKAQAATYNKSAQNNPNLITARQARVNDVLKNLNENSFSDMVQVARKKATTEDFVNPQNLFARVGHSLGVGSEGGDLFSTLSEILPSLPPEDQDKIKEQFKAGTINKQSLLNMVNTYARKSQSEYYTQRLADKLLNTAPQYTQGVANGQKMITTLRSSPALNTTLKAEDGVPYQQKFLEALDKDYQDYYNENPTQWEDHVYQQLNNFNKKIMEVENSTKKTKPKSNVSTIPPWKQR